MYVREGKTEESENFASGGGDFALIIKKKTKICRNIVDSHIDKILGYNSIKCL